MMLNKAKVNKGSGIFLALFFNLPFFFIPFVSFDFICQYSKDLNKNGLLAKMSENFLTDVLYIYN